MKKLACFSIFVVVMTMAVGSSYATPVENLLWDWQILNSGINVGPTDDVVIKARLFNKSDSGVTIGSQWPIVQTTLLYDTEGINTYVPQTTPHYYEGDLDSYDYTGFYNMVLNPGEYKDFDFAIYKHIGVVPDGEYSSDYLNLGFRYNDSLGGGSAGEIERSIGWTVGTGRAVPEPISTTLFLLGGATLAARRLRKIR